MLSSTLSEGIRLYAWKTKPTRSRRSSVRRVSFSPEISRPSMRTLPAVGESSPAAQCIRVLLPEPEGPITARNVPCSTVSDTSSRARTPPG